MQNMKRNSLKILSSDLKPQQRNIIRKRRKKIINILLISSNVLLFGSILYLFLLLLPILKPELEYQFRQLFGKKQAALNTPQQTTDSATPAVLPPLVENPASYDFGLII